MTPLRKIPLDKGWRVKQSSNVKPIATSYIPVAQFPTVVHLDLLANDLIPDPYIGTNEVTISNLLFFPSPLPPQPKKHSG
ncbi:hypothetical protein DFP73DRAFT_95198 [Morchella snyderi]|nr:hypothetical protein DFP73DRAFT_95198 [Morchella snyderi]